MRATGGSGPEAWWYGSYSNLYAVNSTTMSATPSGYTDPYTGSGAWTSYRWFSSYNYRCQPSTESADGTSWHNNPGWSSDLEQQWVEHFVPYTRPRVRRPIRELGGCPAFKTQRDLGGRCLMTDSFARAAKTATGTELYQENPAISNPSGGHGRGEGYNALYGDGSTRWFGDPQMKIRFWPFTNTNTYNWIEASIHSQNRSSGSLAVTYWCSGDRYGRGSPNAYYVGWANMAVWHLFDVAADIDVGVPGPMGE